ncbi:MAG TPA: GntR family transcriptional regulator [Rectinema sp.]|jgi:DNA-binding LacI/PurR family transcriptional regulator|nr:GntR family transcriptional regulator [Rectinema sp.]HOO01660.1 GntR family transcriptional regulator [Rectinema sp.]HPN03901.1 GntR family transcriptional regulator [Rectinema sp.]HPY04956.1 GntR family transcriptional regulator [Rectinema sp.]HQC16765.1 GntR family transcriptional regulator [Rectinema sp.]
MKIDRKSPLSLQYQLYESLKEWFTSSFTVKDCLPTELEIAERFGISRGTVRLALDKLVQDGLIERVAGRGTFLNSDYLIKLRKYRIGVILSEVDFFTNTIWEYSWVNHLEIVNGIMESNLKYNLTTELIAEDYFPITGNADYDGFIVWPYVQDSSKKLLQKPFISMSYTIDILDGFAKIAQDIITEDFRTVGYIGFTFGGRIEVMNNVFAQASHPLIQQEFIVECGASLKEAYRSTMDLLARSPKLDCIVCSTDLRARGVLQFLSENGIKVPGSIAVYGFDGPKRPMRGIPGLTTLRFDWSYPGRYAVASIRNLLDGVPLSPYDPPKGQLVREESTHRSHR